MNKSYHWEIQPMAETDPYFVFTESDSVAVAAQRFEENWGKDVSIRYIRKIAVTEKIGYDEYESADWMVS